ncbi:MAG: glutathione S-transferase family protein [Variovorax sp.]|nr:MAG: glutathione S-transferase family protein [Variovorax sp.]
MSLQLYAHPFSSYCQKALIAFYENDTPFTYRTLEDKSANDELATLWPLKRFPVLVDEGRKLMEASIIIEHLANAHPGPVQLIPATPADALQVRLLDRFFDNYISTPEQKIVFDAIRPAESRDLYGANEARAMLDAAYRWLDGQLADGREWACGTRFSMADCAAAPALFYADWTHAIAPEFANVHAYRRRLLARPSFARAVDEARPFRSYFPLGAPHRD